MRTKNKKVVAVVASDLHLSEKAPLSRAEKEPYEWLARTKQYLDEIADAAKDFDCPIIYPGDIFDKWKVPPELITFALEHLPFGYAIPGQHDLPLHNYEDVTKSAYWTLVTAGTIKNLKAGTDLVVNDEIRLFPFPWNHEVTPLKVKSDPNIVNVAVVHEYIWSGDDTKYPGAPEDKKVSSFKKKLRGYDVAVFGDNHKGFLATAWDCVVCNCGGFMRRKSDEKDYVPMYAKIWSDKTVTRTPYKGLSKDRWIEEDSLKAIQSSGMGEFLEYLDSVQDVSLDFAESVRRYLDAKKVPKEVRKVIADAIGD